MTVRPPTRTVASVSNVIDGKFTSESAKAAAARSAEVRRAKAQQRPVERSPDEALALFGGLPRHYLADMARLTIHDCLDRIASGELAPKTARESAALLQCTSRIVAYERSRDGSESEASGSREDLFARVAELLGQASDEPTT